jgi:hypothetical protein
LYGDSEAPGYQPGPQANGTDGAAFA